MQVITSHINSDFDSLASMIAAKKLYPKACLVFPGSLEDNLRFLLKIPEYQVDHVKIRDIALEQIDLLVLVDTKLADRIGKFSKILDKPHLQIHIYDHHPSHDKEIHGNLEVIKHYGSTATIFTELLQKKNITISPQEATLIALGIYIFLQGVLFSSYL